MINEHDVYYSLQKDLMQLIDLNKEDLDERKDSLEKVNDRDKYSEFDRIVARTMYKEKIKAINMEVDLVDLLHKFYHFTEEGIYNVSDEIIKLLEELTLYIDVEDLVFDINSDVRKNNYFDKIQKLRKQKEVILKLISGNSITKKPFKILDDNNQVRDTTTFEKGITKFAELKEQGLDSDEGIIEVEKKERPLKATEEEKQILSQSEREILESIVSKNEALKVIEICEELEKVIRIEEINKGIKFIKFKEGIQKTISKKHKDISKADRIIRKHELDRLITPIEEESESKTM